MNIFYINIATLFFCVAVIISTTPLGVKVPQGKSIKKKTLARTENGAINVDIIDYPYVVRYEALQLSPDPTRSFKTRHICSGTALSPSSTLTAALCCEAAGDNTKTVVKYDETSSEVLKCTPVVSTRGPSHPLMMSDLALLTTEPVKLTAYGRLSAIDFSSLPGQQVTILGYGLTDDDTAATNATQTTLSLQRVDGMWSKCSDDVVYPVMCVAGTCGVHSACVKDSGGPVVHNTGIVGVSTLAFTNYKCGFENRLGTIDFIYPVGSTIDMIVSLVTDIENENKHKYFQ